MFQKIFAVIAVVSAFAFTGPASATRDARWVQVSRDHQPPAVKVACDAHHYCWTPYRGRYCC